MKISHEKSGEGDVSDLPFSEKFFLWTIRMWVKSKKYKSNAHETLFEGFRLSGLEEGYAALDELMTVVGTATVTSIDVRCPRCPGISIDEQTFIGLIAALQQSDYSGGERLLGFWLRPSGIRLALPPGARLARLLAMRGFALRRREGASTVGAGKAAGVLRRDDIAPKPTTVH